MPDNMIYVVCAAVALILVVIAILITRSATISGLKKDSESKIGNAEVKAREIIDNALKSAEAT